MICSNTDCELPSRSSTINPITYSPAAASSDQALRDYSNAVQARTREIVSQLNPNSLDAVMEADRLRLILVDESLAHSQAEGLLQNYLGWSKGKCLMNFGLTHPFQHVGEIDVIASLLGMDF